MGNNNSRKPANDGFTTAAPSAKAKKATKSANKKTVISVVCMILVLALFAGVLVYNKLGESGYFYRNTVSVTSENYEINNAMLSYYFNVNFQQMAQSLQQMGVDTQKNLKDQAYTSDMTWFDYIMQSMTIPQAEQILVLCEAAKAEGFELSEHDREHIDEAVAEIEEAVKNYSESQGGTEEYYLRAMYGYGITIDDIRDAIELNQLAAAYSEHVTGSYDFSEEDWKKHLDEHTADFQVIDYVSYTFEAAKADTSTTTTTTAGSVEPKTAAPETSAPETSAPEVSAPETSAPETSGEAESTEGTTTEGTTTKKEELTPEKKEALDKANALRDKLMAESDKALDVFNAEVKTLLGEKYKDEKDEKTKNEKIDADLKATKSEAVANDQTNEFLKFAFSSDRDKDVFVSEDNTNGKYTVHLITKAPYIEEYLTRNVRVIVLSAADGEKISDERDSIMEDFEKSDKSEKAFAELAKTHSDDATAHENGGLYENQAKNELNIGGIDEWLYSKDRKVGDYASFSNGQKDANEVIYILYYTGEGIMKWQREVDTVMTSEKYEKDYEALEKKYEVKADLKEAYKIPSQAGL